MKRVLCIILNYKNTDDTLETLSSLAKLRDRELLKTVVVDNGATDESISALQRFDEIPITVVPSRENLGFAGGVNLGFEHGRDDEIEYLWLLNNDALVEKNCLGELVDAAKTTMAGIVSSLILYYPASHLVWFAGGELYKPWFIVKHLGKGKTVDEVGDLRTPREVSFICGCSTLIRRDLFDKVSGFDESLFLYAEDVDLCMKAKELGYSLYLQPRSIVFHKVSLGTGGEFNTLREYYFTRNGFVMISRYVQSRIVRTFAYISRSMWDLYRISSSLLRSGLSPIRAWSIFSAALFDFWSNNLGKTSREIS